MARPTKYDDAKAQKIATLLRSGCTRKDAAGSVGVIYETLVNWIASNSSFSLLVESAEAYCAVKMTTIITKAATDGDARYAVEWLKRRRRDEWGDSTTVDLDRKITDLLETLAGGG